jgi:hypothetical protein
MSGVSRDPRALRPGGGPQLKAPEHRPTANLAERADRKLQPAAGLAARSLDEAQFAVGQQETLG